MGLLCQHPLSVTFCVYTSPLRYILLGRFVYMAQYLLKAPDEDMEIWKATAKARGQSLAQYLRNAANSVADSRTRPVSVEVSDPVVLATAQLQNALARQVVPRKRSYEPDPR